MRVNGLDLHVELDGAGSPPLLLLHGFTGSSAAWADVRVSLRQRRQLVLVDLIGHGLSAAPDDAERYTLECAALDLLALLDQLEITQTDMLGYSMGGRLALHLAVHAPERVRRLVLESASPGLADAQQRAARLAADGQLAERIERDGVAAFVAEWEQQPLLALGGQVPGAVRRRQHLLRLDQRAQGLANSLRGMGAGRQTPLWDRLDTLRCPTLLVVGERDARYRAVADQMRALLPAAAIALVPDAGHTVHLDQPAPFASLVTDVLGS